MHDDEISITDLVAVLRAQWRTIAISTFVVASIAVTIAFIMPEKFESTTVLAVATSEGDAGKLGGAGVLLGLASLGGLTIDGGGVGAESIATLGSAALTEQFIRDHNLLPVLFENEWDAAKGDWITDDVDERPTVWDAEKIFSEKVRIISEDKKTGLVTLKIKWTDPNLAAIWANELVARTNKTLRDRAVELATRNLNYLNEQLAETSIFELRQAIYGLIDNEIKKIMVAKGSEEYAFKVIDPARPSEEKSSPRRGLITAAGAILGFLFGLIYVIFSVPPHSASAVKRS